MPSAALHHYWRYRVILSAPENSTSMVNLKPTETGCTVTSTVVGGCVVVERDTDITFEERAQDQLQVFRNLKWTL